EQVQKIIDAADEVITALAGTNDDFHPDNSTKMAQLYDDLNDRYAPPEVVRELARAMLASMDAEPVAWECGENIILFNPDTVEAYAKRAEISPKPLYATPPVQETGVYNDVLNIIGLLENNEWAEHCTSTVLGSLLESEITRLVGKEQPVPVVPEGLRMALSNAGISAPESDEMLAVTHERYIQALVTWVRERKPFQPVPVVPEEMPKDLAGQIVSLLAHNIGDKFLAQKIWNTCRAAMLNGGKS
ncbi:TPA: hypothetical protein ACSVAN_003452, partial [Salmonella enterica subsp. diarizonae]